MSLLKRFRQAEKEDKDESSKPNLVIAYNMKRRQKAQGGLCGHGTIVGECPKCTYQPNSSSEVDATKMAKMAEGGMLTKDGYQSPMPESAGYTGDMTHPDLKDHEEDEWMKKEYDKKHAPKSDMAAMLEDDRRLGEHGEIEEGPQGVRMAEGGQVEDDGTDMVGRIIKQRQQMFSKGGRVANTDKPVADGMRAEYDDLHLRDELNDDGDATYTGANSGDEDSSPGEDNRRMDLIERIMASRRKKPGHNPSPA